MLKSHCTTHMSANDTTFRSCLDVWIVHARHLARKIAAYCPECRRRYKVFLSQREGELPTRSLLFIGCPPFTSTAINFLGPYKVKAMNNSRSHLKVWPIIFGCLNTRALHIELNKTYGTDALL